MAITKSHQHESRNFILITSEFNLVKIELDPRYEPATEDKSFIVDFNDQHNASVTYKPPHKLRVRLQYCATKKLLTWLNTTDHYTTPPPEIECHIGDIKNLSTVYAHRIAEVIKHFTRRFDIADQLTTDCHLLEWSHGTEAGKKFPRELRTQIIAISTIRIDNVAAKAIQSTIKDSIRPLAGERYLFRAIQESSPRFQWIDATIAAELSVKDALIRRKPDIAALLEEMPSPPLSKLYGSILKEYLGEISPVRTELIKGSEIRNKLIHQPTDTPVTQDDAKKYIRSVDSAIQHLYKILYPNWEMNEYINQASPPNKIGAI